MASQPQSTTSSASPLSPLLRAPEVEHSRDPQPTPGNIDIISLRCLHTYATLGPDAWARPRSQPLILSLHLTIDTTSAALTDNIAETFSYGLMAKDTIAKIEGKAFTSLDHLTSILTSLAITWPGNTLYIVARAPKALLRCTPEGGLRRELRMQRREQEIGGQKRQFWHVIEHGWVVGGIMVACIIGVNDCERLEKQGVFVAVSAMGEREQDGYAVQMTEGCEMWRRLVRGICALVELSSFKTLEALAAHIARYTLANFPFPRVTISVEKPSALTFVDGAGVAITRDRRWLEGLSGGDGGG